MRFKQGIREGSVRIITPDYIRAQSLFKSSLQAISSAKKIALETDTLKSILRELYEGLRQYCEAIGYQRGYKFSSHEVITLFLEEILSDSKIALRFDRYRKIRNGINYYGDDVSIETVKEALVEMPSLIKNLEKYVKKIKN
ncbi:hypothetical protein J4421_05910 [Candidatus Woesearchaeota archaeon]|nr:hypothetical protein [Candidatus Woesearchaeota archaeon]